MLSNCYNCDLLDPELFLSDLGGVRCLLFAELAKLAIPVVKHYLSDLYHDVNWINANVTEPMTFFYGVRECGTSIGTDQDLVVYGNERVWEVTLSCDGEQEGQAYGYWYASFQEVTSDKP